MPQKKIIRNLSLTAIACFCLFAARPAAATDAAIQAQQMGGGVNVLGYDPIWSDPAKAVFKERHFAIIKKAGFKTLRVNLQAFPHMNTTNELDPQWLKTLDWVVSEATGQGMIVILDENALAELFFDLLEHLNQGVRSVQGQPPHVDPQAPQRRLTRPVVRIEERAGPTVSLGGGDRLQQERRLATPFPTEDLHDPTARPTICPQRQVERQ